LLVVDVGRRLQLAVEHDREVLGKLLDRREVVRASLARGVRLLLPAACLRLRDVAELLVALALEAELDDVALSGATDVRLDRGELELGPVRLRDRVRTAVGVVLEEVVVGALGRARSGTARRARAADNGRVGGDGE